MRAALVYISVIVIVAFAAPVPRSLGGGGTALAAEAAYCCPSVSGGVMCCDGCALATGDECPGGLSPQICEGETVVSVSCTSATDAAPAAAPSGTSAEALSGSAPGKTYEVPNKLLTPYLQVAIGNLARVLLGIAGSIALAVFVWGGVMLITSAGDTKKVDQGRKMMVWTAIGLAVMFGAEAIVRTLLGAILGGG